VLPETAGKEKTELTRCRKPLARKKLSRHAAGNRWQGKNGVDSLPETAGKEKTGLARCRKPPARKKLSRHAAGNRWQEKNGVDSVSAIAGKGKNQVGTPPANGKAAATVTGNVFKALN